MRCGGLFSGIGGFELAAQWAGLQNVWSNEIDTFCCKVLEKNFNHEIIQADIRDCGKGRKHELAPVDLIFGGFPCQPFSTAGKRSGVEDDRYLWPEMLRVITEIKPAFVVGENVAGLLSMDNGNVFEQICASLEDQDYEVESFIVPACAKGAPHRRDRVWIVAHRIGKYGWQECKPGIPRMERTVFQDEGREKGAIGRKAHNREPALIANNAEWIDGTHNREQEERQEYELGESFSEGAFTNTNIKGLQGGKLNGTPNQGKWNGKPHEPTPEFYKSSWQKHWYEAATGLCGVDDGLSTELDKLKNSDRTKRLKGLGNAIVSQVAFEILNAIRIIYEE